jgi:hydroxyacylglutathione hydrolase
MFDVLPVPAFSDNYIWLIVATGNRRVAIVDPGDAAPVFDAIEMHNLIPAAILATHHHGDHVGGIPELVSRYEIPVYGPRLENIPRRTHGVGEGDSVHIDAIGAQFSVIDIPGHTAGHVAYHGHGMAFVGDTLFLAGCGRLFEGTAQQMHRSLGKVAALSDETLVYCGHEYTVANLRFAVEVEPENRAIRERLEESLETRRQNRPTVPAPLSVEKQTNPFLRTHEAVVQSAASTHAGHPISNAVEVFAEIRRWKDAF